MRSAGITWSYKAERKRSHRAVDRHRQAFRATLQRVAAAGRSLTEPGDRRPIAARDWRPIQDAAAWLIGRRASPNAISVAGMVAAMLAGALFAATAGSI